MEMLQSLVSIIKSKLSELKSPNFQPDGSGGLLLEPEHLVIRLDGTHVADRANQEKLQREVNRFLATKPIEVTLADKSVVEVKAIKLVVSGGHNVYLSDIAIGSIKSP